MSSPLHNPRNIKSLQNAMIGAAHAGGKILAKHYGKKITIREKKGAGLVTNADLESEAKIVRMLKKAYPGFGFLTEEDTPKPAHGSSGRWIIDPLDGTTNFVHGFPMFCVSLAAEWEGVVIGGVIYHPILDETYLAIRGKGAWIDGKPMHVSRTKKLRDSLLTTGFTYQKEEGLHHEMKAFERLSSIARAVRRPGSAALDLAYVARGIFDGFWERSLSAWDVAAGALLVEEAGGKVTNFSGGKFQVEGREILATNKILHTPLLQIISPETCPI